MRSHLSWVSRPRAAEVAQEKLNSRVTDELRPAEGEPIDTAACHEECDDAARESIAPTDIQSRGMLWNAIDSVIVDFGIEFERLGDGTAGNEAQNPLLRPLPRDIVAGFHIQIDFTY